MLRSLRANTVARSQSITNRSGYVATLSLYLERATSSRGSRASSRSMPALSPPLLNSATQYLCCFTYLSGDHQLKLRVFAESSGRIQGMKAQESCAFVSELDFGEGFDLASEMDDKSGEATSATLGFVLLPGFSAGTDGMRRFR